MQSSTTERPAGITADPDGWITVDEDSRKVGMRNGTVLIFTGVTRFNPSGSMLRLKTDQGYVLLNKEQIDFMVIQGEIVA